MRRGCSFWFSVHYDIIPHFFSVFKHFLDFRKKITVFMSVSRKTGRFLLPKQRIYVKIKVIKGSFRGRSGYAQCDRWFRTLYFGCCMIGSRGKNQNGLSAIWSLIRIDENENILPPLPPPIFCRAGGTYFTQVKQIRILRMKIVWIVWEKRTI